MSRQLWLIRHAKSSWDEPHLADKQRPLAPRGHKAAQLMASHYAKQFSQLELVHYSPALRAQQTCEYWLEQRSQYLKGSALEVDLQISCENSLYTFRWADLLVHIQALPNQINKIALVGHNPAFEDLVNYLTGEDLIKFPTASLTLMEADLEWQNWSEYSACLRLFDTPKKLAERL
ncbi:MULTISPECIES: SixA phosphatase family protein [unclassified Agarivorans]|uniref:SixA phosphatase family protein n=1 Tax=unclassified Agarivorans TaxID=2636026 RepID=UPI0026E263B3|nr:MULTISPECIES: histidine phosphatase family protein [unclassified Agarivorans]MDO6687646.1 histidine phosphatase family protein [Agarivorans sp. 3_MG-2023]MDO6717200.1 histidine phosphatase family protein [Agarivorans sp. 2_MG-2023]